MTSLTTPQMIGYARAWLAAQFNSTPRDILQQLHDMVVELLGVDNPPDSPTITGETNFTTPQLLGLANKFLDSASGLSPNEFLVEIKDATQACIQQLPKWKCSMFFKGISGGVDSSLNYACIDGAESTAHRNFSCDAIRRNGGDTLLFIAEKMFRNPGLQSEVFNALNYPVSIGIKHLIVDLKNDNGNLAWENMEEHIREQAAQYARFNSEQVAFMTCLESDEVLTVAQCQQMVRWCKQYAPLKRVIVGSANSGYLKSIGNGAEMWLEIHTPPFHLTQADVDRYIADLQALLPYGPVWAGEYWSTTSPFGAYISKRAVDIGCAGIGSYVG
jgi:hypothetical protein